MNKIVRKEMEMVNKTKQQVAIELETVRRNMRALQRSQTRLEVLAQFQGQGVTQPRSMPFTAGKGRQA